MARPASHPRARPAPLRIAVLVALLPLAVGCGVDGDGSSEREETALDAAPSATSDASARAGGEATVERRGNEPRVEETDQGVGVEMTLSPGDPVRAGALALEARAETPPPANTEAVVDIFAPQMPAHGIIRFTAERQEDGSVVADVEVPMEGRWTFYVDLGPETGTAAFPVQVEPGDSPAGDPEHDHMQHDHGEHDHGEHHHGEHHHERGEHAHDEHGGDDRSGHEDRERHP